LSQFAPLLIANLFQMVVEGDKCIGLDWHALRLVDLTTGGVLSEIKTGELEPRFGHRSPWVASIVGAGVKEEEIFLRLAIPQEKETRLRYHLVKMDLAHKKYELITELRGGFC